MVSGEASAARVPRLFIDEPDAVQAGLLTIHGSVVHRLSRVLRLRRGDALEVIHDGTFYDAVLLRVGRDSAEAEVRGARIVHPEPPPRVTLCPSVIRAQRFDLMVEKVTELGVGRIRPLRATRSLAKSRGLERIGRWKRLITEASEQCRREDRPRIDEPVELLDLVAEPRAVGIARLFASARERSRTLDEALAAAPHEGGVALLVGPEGGFTLDEAGAAEAGGWIPVSLGPRPLRAETASIVGVALAQAALWRRRQPAN